MNGKVAKFLAEAKERESKKAAKERDATLISLGLTEGVKREYGPYGRPYVNYDREAKKYYYDRPIPVEVTDEEYAEILKYAPARQKPAKPVSAAEKPVSKYPVNPGAENTINAVATVLLVVGIVASVACAVFGFVAMAALGDPEAWWIGIIAGALLLLASFVQWASVKVIVNISRSLYNINASIQAK